MTPLIDKAKAAEILSVSRKTVDRLRGSGDLKSVKVRGRILFDQMDIQDFINNQKQGSPR